MKRRLWPLYFFCAAAKDMIFTVLQEFDDKSRICIQYVTIWEVLLFAPDGNVVSAFMVPDAAASIVGGAGG